MLVTRIIADSTVNRVFTKFHSPVITPHPSCLLILSLNNKKQTPWPLVRERTIPTCDRRLSGEVSAWSTQQIPKAVFSIF
jgi:hypothetical protein